MSLSVHAILFCERPSVTINQSYASDKTLAWVSLINYKKVACSDKASCDLELVSMYGETVTTAFFNDVNGVEHVANDEDVYCIVFNDNNKIIARGCNTPRTVICEDPCSVAEGTMFYSYFDCVLRLQPRVFPSRRRLRSREWRVSHLRAPRAHRFSQREHPAGDGRLFEVRLWNAL